MTREEILADLYLVNRVCRGLPTFDQATRDTLTARLATCRADADYAAVLTQMEAALSLQSGALVNAVKHECNAIQSVIYSFRENCGQDFNKIIATYPFDGRSRDVVCPKCGAAQHFQSPNIG